MTPDRIKEAVSILKRYKDGKSRLDARIVANEQWYKLRHWEIIQAKENPGDPQPASAWLHNSLSNKHADAMDNYPEPNVLPREQSDEQNAETLNSVLPVVLEQNDYERIYSDKWWYKLKTGTAVTGVFWDNSKNNGLGDIDIRKIDILNLFWEPGITDIQKSRNVFHIELVHDDLLKEQYEVLKDKLGADGLEAEKYFYDDSVDTKGKSVVVDWYYKVRTEDGRTVLHFCKFCSGESLYASEDDEQYAQRGFYDHGDYPFVFDTLFPVEGSPAGFGYVDICKSPQLYIDKLDQAILKNAVQGARRRYWVRKDSNINEKEYADLSNDFVHYAGAGNPNEGIMPIEIPSLSSVYENIRLNKIEELKETSGNRDFSQGGTSSGVTAASAIAALQEAGSKLSRDMIKASYRAHVDECYLVLELMRQFYQEARIFRITNTMGKPEYKSFSGQMIAAQPQEVGFGVSESIRKPIFDIKVKAQRSSPFSTVAQNERAKELYGMGFFMPNNADQSLAALDMMQFEGIEAARERISQNGTLQQRLEQLAPIALMMAQELDMIHGTNEAPRIAQLLGAAPPQPTAGRGETGVNTLGQETGRNTRVEAARVDAANKSMPR